jgi:hypothetical protein
MSVEPDVRWAAIIAPGTTAPLLSVMTPEIFPLASFTLAVPVAMELNWCCPQLRWQLQLQLKQ